MDDKPRCEECVRLTSKQWELLVVSMAYFFLKQKQIIQWAIKMDAICCQRMNHSYYLAVIVYVYLVRLNGVAGTETAVSCVRRIHNTIRSNQKRRYG